MTQFLRPSADTLRDNWSEDDATTDALYAEIDESSPADADYIQTQLVPTNDVYVTKLTSADDPGVSTGHTVRVRRSKSAAAGAQIDLTIQLRQGYVSEGSLGTLIAAVATLTNISETWTDTAYTLSGAEADAITNYSDLYLRFVGNQV